MILFFVSLILAAIFFLMAGIIFAPILTGNRESIFDFSDYSIIGFFTITNLLGIIHFILPINNQLFAVLLIVFSLVIIGDKKRAIIFQRAFFDFFRIAKRRWIFVLLIVLIVCYSASSTITYFDSNLYHIQNIKWIKEYSIVPGLGNIHGRFAFNSYVFLVDALTGIMIGDVLLYPVNSLLLGYLLFKIFKLKQPKISCIESYATLVIICLILLLTVYLLNSTSTDIPVTLLILYVLTILFIKKQQISTSDYFLISLVGVSLLTIKISALLLIVVPVCIFVFRFRYKLINFSLKMKMRLMIVSFIVFSVFVLRNIVLSGYLVYPLSELDLLNVDWKIPSELVLFERVYIESWAKIRLKPTYFVSDLPLIEWIPRWWIGLDFYFKTLLISTTIATVILAKKLYKSRDVSDFIILVFVVIIIAYWLITAPDPRFILAILIFQFSILCGFVFNAINNKYLPVATRLTPYFALIAALVSFMSTKPKQSDFTLKRILLPATCEHGEMAKYRNGFEYYSPKNDARCFDTKLPCLPARRNDVVLRGKTLQGGFKVGRKMSKEEIEMFIRDHYKIELY